MTRSRPLGLEVPQRKCGGMHSPELRERDGCTWSIRGHVLLLLVLSNNSLFSYEHARY